MLNAKFNIRLRLIFPKLSYSIYIKHITWTQSGDQVDVNQTLVSRMSVAAYAVLVDFTSYYVDILHHGHNAFLEIFFFLSLYGGQTFSKSTYLQHQINNTKITIIIYFTLTISLAYLKQNTIGFTCHLKCRSLHLHSWQWQKAELDQISEYKNMIIFALI